jgi:hypothetical protein
MALLNRLRQAFFGTVRSETGPGFGSCRVRRIEEHPGLARERDAQAEAGPLMPIIMSRNDMGGF